MKSKKKSTTAKVFSLILSAWLAIGSTVVPAMAADTSNQKNPVIEDSSITTTVSEGESSDSAPEPADTSNENTSAKDPADISDENTASENPADISEKSPAAVSEPTESGEKSPAAASTPTAGTKDAIAFPYITVGGVKVTEENKADILGDGTCSFAYNDQLKKWELTLNNANISNSFISATTHTDYVIKLVGENKISSTNNAIRVLGNLTITGTGSLTINSTNGLSIEVVSLYGQNPSGVCTISDKVTLDCTSPYQAISSASDFNITGATVTANTAKEYNAVITVGKDCTISGGTVTATAKGNSTNAIKAAGKTVIKDQSKVTLSSVKVALTASGDLNISDSTVAAESTESNALYAANKIAVSNSTVNATANYSGLRGQRGIDITNSQIDVKSGGNALFAYSNITIMGDSSSVNAVSDTGSAIYALDGKINLLTDDITATGAAGSAAIVARASSENNTGEIPNNIVLGDKLAANKDNITGSTVWQPSDDESIYYSDTAFVPAGTALPLSDLSTAPNSVTIAIAGANYDKIDELLLKVPADLTLYTDETVNALNAAIKAVDRTKTIFEQEEVNAYAVAIENALTSLVLKPVIISGANQTVEQGKDAAFGSDANYKDFKKVLVDGIEISPDKYMVKEGSTIVTLKADYVSTLSIGKHTISIVSANGQADAEFTVKAAAPTPTVTPKPTVTPNPTVTSKPTVTPKPAASHTVSAQTGDNYNSVLWISILGVSVLAIIILFISRKKVQTKR